MGAILLNFPHFGSKKEYIDILIDKEVLCLHYPIFKCEIFEKHI